MVFTELVHFFLLVCRTSDEAKDMRAGTTTDGPGESSESDKFMVLFAQGLRCCCTGDWHGLSLDDSERFSGSFGTLVSGESSVSLRFRILESAVDRCLFPAYTAQSGSNSGVLGGCTMHRAFVLAPRPDGGVGVS